MYADSKIMCYVDDTCKRTKRAHSLNGREKIFCWNNILSIRVAIHETHRMKTTIVFEKKSSFRWVPGNVKSCRPKKKTKFCWKSFSRRQRALLEWRVSNVATPLHHLMLFTLYSIQYSSSYSIHSVCNHKYSVMMFCSTIVNCDITCWWYALYTSQQMSLTNQKRVQNTTRTRSRNRWHDDDMRRSAAPYRGLLQFQFWNTPDHRISSEYAYSAHCTGTGTGKLVIGQRQNEMKIKIVCERCKEQTTMNNVWRAAKNAPKRKWMHINL